MQYSYSPTTLSIGGRRFHLQRISAHDQELNERKENFLLSLKNGVSQIIPQKYSLLSESDIPLPHPQVDHFLQIVLLLHHSFQERNSNFHVLRIFRLVAFNLGYLPGGDKTIITEPRTTLEALKVSKDILMPGGLISLVVYVGHPGGG